MKLFLALILLAPIAAAQPVLRGWAVVDSQAYAGKQLFGYINGGAELYHEYGFVRLDVRRFRRGNMEATVDVYQMSDAAAAYGLVSLRASGPGARITAQHTQRDEIGAHGASALVGRRWIQLTITPPDTAHTVLPALLRALRSQYRAERFTPAPLLRPGRPDIIGQHRRMYGPLGLQSAFPALEALFDGLDGYTVETIDISAPAGLRLIARITFRDTQTRATFLRHAGFDEQAVYATSWSVREQDGRRRAVRLGADARLYLVVATAAAAEFAEVLKRVALR